MGNGEGQLCAEHTVKIEKLEESDKEQWVVIEKIRNRLPGYATLVISVLTFLLGVAVAVLGKS